MFSSSTNSPRITLSMLIDQGYFKPDTLVHFRSHYARVAPNGLLYPSNFELYSVPLWLDKEYETPSAWATAVARNGNPDAKNACNGWTCIKLVGTNELIDVFRQHFLFKENNLENKENENATKTTLPTSIFPTPKSKPGRSKSVTFSLPKEHPKDSHQFQWHNPTLTPIAHAVPVPTLSPSNTFSPFCFSCSSPSTNDYSSFSSIQNEHIEHSDMVHCIHCGEWYHKFCITSSNLTLPSSSPLTPKSPFQKSCDFHNASLSPTSSQNWQCANCLVCKVCLDSEPEYELLVCDRCETGTHLRCLKVGLDSIPEGRWLCDDCVKCKECGSRTPAGKRGKNKTIVSSSLFRWKFDYSHCEPCGILREKGNLCPICDHVYDDDDYETHMVQCDAPTCAKWVHLKCDPDLTETQYQKLCEDDTTESYLCPKCRGDSSLEKQPGNSTPIVSSSVETPESTPPNAGLSAYVPSLFQEFPGNMDIGQYRRCVICLKNGDQPPKREGRLLFLASWGTLLGHCENTESIETVAEDWGWWFHAKCLAYQRDYNLMMEGSLTTKMKAIIQAAQNKCEICTKLGAPIRCAETLCHRRFHYHCSRNDESVLFTKTMKLYCKEHASLVNSQIHLRRKDRLFKVELAMPISDRDLDTSTPLATLEEWKHLANWLKRRKSIISGSGLSEFELTGQMLYSLRIGALNIISLGVFPLRSPTSAVYLLDHHLIIPVHFKCCRIFTSYLLSSSHTYVFAETIIATGNEILNQEEKPPLEGDVIWKISILDDSDNPIFAKSIKDAVKIYLGRVGSFRKEYKLPLLPKCHHYHVDPFSFVGLHHPVIKRAIENLPNSTLTSPYYSFSYTTRESARFQTNLSIRFPQALLKHWGAFTFRTTCSRTEGLLPLQRKKWNSGKENDSPSVHLQGHSLHSSKQRSNAISISNPSELGEDLPQGGNATGTMNTMTPFLIPIRSKYRVMKQNERYALRVKPSKIAGFGLYATKSFEKDDMVVEYVGEIIGQKLADIREMEYERRRKGYYMFSLDYDQIIDATMKGNKGRFINHSCEPNCYARIISVDLNKKVVVIFANRYIESEEELTYDYKFNLDDDPAQKIPCMCGATKCRRYMN